MTCPRKVVAIWKEKNENDILEGVCTELSTY